MRKTLILLACSILAAASFANERMKKNKDQLSREVVLVCDEVVPPFICEQPIFELGVALSGGGAHGFAHAGVLKAMEEVGIRANVVAGTSAGAIAGAMYAAGVTPEQMVEVFGSIRFFQIPKLHLFGRDNGVDSAQDRHDSYIRLKIQDLEKIVARALPVSRFEELQIPLVVNATDIARGSNVYFSTGDLVRPIVASSAIPMFFKSVTINNVEYVDGGVIQNLPVSALRQACKYVIAVDVNPMEDFSNQSKMLEREWERVFRLMIRANTLKDKEQSDLFIQPTQLVHYSIFDTKHGEEMFWIGYNHAKPILEQFAKAHPELVRQAAQ